MGYNFITCTFSMGCIGVGYRPLILTFLPALWKANDAIHPRKLTYSLKRDYFNRKYIDSNHHFSGETVSFQGGYYKVIQPTYGGDVCTTKTRLWISYQCTTDGHPLLLSARQSTTTRTNFGAETSVAVLVQKGQIA